MNIVKSIALCAFTLFCNYHAITQELYFETLTSDNELTDNRFNSFIFEDSYNYTWISSLTGVFRFDGCNLSRKSINLPNVSENIQSTFFEDKENNLWYSVYEGIICYIRKKDAFEVYQLRNSDNKVIDFNYKAIHLELKNGILWFRAGDSIYNFKVEDPLSPNHITSTVGENFTVISRNEKVDFIISNTMGKTDYSEIFDIDNQTLVSSSKISFPNPILSSLYHSDSLWIYQGQSKIWGYNNQKKELKEIVTSDSLKFRQITSFDQKNILISTNSGIWLYNLILERFTKSWKNQKYIENSILDDNSFDLSFTSGKRLWVSHDGKGLSYSNKPKSNFSTSLRGVNITGLQKLNKSLIIGKSNPEIVLYNNETDSLTSISVPSEEEIWSITNKEQDVFLSVKNDVFCVSLEKNSQSKLDNKFELTSYRRLSNIYPNRTVVSTTTGIKEIHKSPSSNEYYIGECSEFKDYPTFSFIQLFQSHHSLKAYVPYNATDLWVYQATPDSLRLLTKLKTGLEFFGFTDSQKEPGTIWAGSAKGLIKITQDTVITRLMDKDEKLKNVAVYSVVEDKKGVLWLGTNQGLFQYFPDSRQTYQYEEIDGLPSRTFSLLNSAIMTEEGEIWMGTNKGVVRFNPDEVKPYATPPNIYIDGLLINDTEPLKGIGERDSLHLSYEENTLLFDVKAIGYYKAKRNKINYRLQGYENDWVSVKNGQMIRYAKLPPGVYTLQVQAEDVNGNQSQVHDLQIFVRPPFWQTWWFYLLLTLTATGSAFALYRYRVGLIRKEEEQKTAVANLNLQVVETEMKVLETEMKALKAQMNPHFLFNSMNSIKGLILKQETRKASEYLTKFSVLLRSILANSEERYILLETELETLRLYIELEALRFTRDINYSIETASDIEADFISIPPLVIQPFVENAIWHGLLPKKTGKNKLTIRVERDNDFIVCSVQDNGVGRTATTKPKSLQTHKSMGIGITRKRIELVHPENSVHIIDLQDKNGKATGTQVVLRIYEPE